MVSSRLLRAWRASALLAIACVASAVNPAVAVTIDFEAPTYTAADLIGQNGWVKNAYFGPVNGLVVASTSSPLSGAQSLSYTQASAGGFSDISKANVLSVPAGITGTDVTLSYVITANTGAYDAPNGGVFLGNGAIGGASPIFARIFGSSIEVGSAGGFSPANLFFLPGERIKMTYEIDFDNSSMNFIAENLEVGDVFSQTYPFFASYGAPTGPNGEYQIDVGVFLRGGNVKIDDITLTAGVGPLVTDYEWVPNASGNWNSPANWAPTGLPGVIPGRQSAKLGASITANQTIYTNSTRNLNELEINNANSYVLAGVGSLEFQADTSGATTIMPKIMVAAGAHQVQLPVSLNDNTTITVAGGASLDLNNQINLNGKTLTTSGTVRINHSTIGGGSVVSLGALATEGLASFGGDLTSTGVMSVTVAESGNSFYQVAGDALFSGILDVVWTASSLPSGPMTIASAAGSLDATGLTLSPEDAKSFALGADGNNLTLTFLGVTVPEPTSVGMLAVAAMGLTLVRGRRTYARRAACGLAAVVVAGAAAPALAINYNFENPPYTAGNIIGQQNWNTPGYVLADPFFGGVVNGTATVSAASPISGAQSLLYSQTVDPPLAGNTGAGDVSRASAVFAKKDGTPANDLTASFQIRTDANGVGSGSAGFFLGRAGSSPIFVLITDASSTAGTGSVLIGDNAAFATSTYVANSVYEYTFGVDVDSATYEVTSRNITAGTPAQALTGSGPNGRFVFLGGGFASDGDDQTYTFDTTVLLRSGEARIDNITAVGDDFTEALWVGGSGAWGANASWIPRMIPNADAAANGQIAIFGSGATTPQTVFTNTVQTVNGLRFDNANKYAIGGAGSIALKANTIGGTVNPTVNVIAGSHELQLPVSVLDNTTFTVNAGAQLDVNNNVSLGGKTLSTAGTVNLNVGVTGGGSIVNSGTLGTAGTTPFAANLTSTGTLAFDLGPANKDFFNITGNATLSGLVDVTLEPGFVPVGSYTLLTVTGTLNTAGLTLSPSDASQFSLGVSGKSLVLTVGGSTSLPGDFNNSGTVDGADLAKWKADFGTANGSDANGDNIADGSDFLIWQRNYGRTAAVPAAAAVPEPAAIALASVVALFGGLIGRRSR